MDRRSPDPSASSGPSTVESSQNHSKELLALESTDNPSPFLINKANNGTATSLSQPPPPSKPSRPEICKVPKSNVLNRVQQFLPQLQAANTKLAAAMQTRPKEEFDIENVNEEDEHIEMNLAVGLLEEQRPLDEQTIVIPKGSSGAVDSDSDSEQLHPVRATDLKDKRN